MRKLSGMHQQQVEFMCFGVVSPGSTNINVSYPMAPEFQKAFDSLSVGRCGLADVAYILSESILIPFSGTG